MDMARRHWGALAIVVAVLALVLVGCGSGAQGPEGAGGQQEPEPAKEELPFAGRKKRDASELDEYVEKALDVRKKRQSKSKKDQKESELTVEQAKAFAAANDAYKNGEYAAAQEGYEGILADYGEHYGANVNLALAMLQQQKNDDALVQALACMGLYPSDDGALLNVQAAAVACGFSAQDALDDAALAVVRKVRAGASLGKGMKNRLEYNRLWDEIETELYDVAQGKATDGDATYQKLLADADKLARGGLSKDEDLQALRAYLLAVGTQLGLEDGEADKDEKAAGKDDAKDSSAATSKDESGSASKTTAKSSGANEPGVDLDAAQAHVGLPYVVADDEACTIVFTGYHMAGKNPVAEFEFVNNSNEKLHFNASKNVTGNGTEIQNLSAAWPTVEPGEQESAWGSFFAKDGDKTVSVLEGDLTQLSCVASAGQWGSSNKKTYPLKWEADPKQATKDVGVKLLDEENDVTLTVTKVLPASDGVVVLEYRGSRKGSGKVLLDGSGWKVNGKDVELLGAGSPLGTGTVGHHHLMFRAKSASDLRNGAVESISGTLVLRDQDGKELVSKKIDTSFAG